MQMVLVIAQTLALTLASAVTGIVLCGSLWLLFRLIGHPQWGPPLIVVPVVFAMAGQLPDSEFLRRTLIFAAAAVGPFCIAGLVWRANRRDRRRARTGSDAAVPAASPPSRYLRYPAIAACICEDRRPSHGELKSVTMRIWREAFAARYPTPGFAERRAVLRAARAALEGHRAQA
jgi:hypothetical protein